MVSQDPGVWVAALFIMMGYSIVVRDNPFYRFAERTLVGVTAGVLAVQGLENVKKLAITPLMKGEVINIVPILIGLLVFFRISRKYAYISRIPLSMMLGSGIAVGMVRSIPAEIIGQVKGLFSAIPLKATPLDYLNIILVPLFVICTLLYFTYTREHTGTLGVLTKIGRYAIAFGLGANFGNMVMTRTNYVIRPLQIILYKWLGIKV